MSNFKGHVLPGTLFLILGAILLAYDLVVYARRGLAGLSERSTKRKSRRFRWCEAVFKICAGAIGHYAENMKLGFDSPYASIIGHKTMYLWFSISGVADVLALRRLLPETAAPLGTAMALAVEQVLLFSHAVSAQDTELETRIHVMLTVGVLISVIAAAADFLAPRSWRGLWALTFDGSIILQGTWWIQMAFFLFGDPPMTVWIHEEGTKLHHPTDFVTTAFVWHGTWIAAVVTAIVVIINVVHRRLGLSFEIPGSGAAADESSRRGIGGGAIPLATRGSSSSLEGFGHTGYDIDPKRR